MKNHTTPRLMRDGQWSVGYHSAPADRGWRLSSWLMLALLALCGLAAWKGWL